VLYLATIIGSLRWVKGTTCSWVTRFRTATLLSAVKRFRKAKLTSTAALMTMYDLSLISNVTPLLGWNDLHHALKSDTSPSYRCVHLGLHKIPLTFQKIAWLFAHLFVNINRQAWAKKATWKKCFLWGLTKLQLECRCRATRLRLLTCEQIGRITSKLWRF